MMVTQREDTALLRDADGDVCMSDAADMEYLQDNDIITVPETNNNETASNPSYRSQARTPRWVNRHTPSTTTSRDTNDNETRSNVSYQDVARALQAVRLHAPTVQGGVQATDVEDIPVFRSNNGADDRSPRNLINQAIIINGDVNIIQEGGSYRLVQGHQTNRERAVGHIIEPSNEPSDETADDSGSKRSLLRKLAKLPINIFRAVAGTMLTIIKWAVSSGVVTVIVFRGVGLALREYVRHASRAAAADVTSRFLGPLLNSIPWVGAWPAQWAIERGVNTLLYFSGTDREYAEALYQQLGGGVVDRVGMPTQWYNQIGHQIGQIAWRG